MKRSNKKGFTIVELVVVIAIIAVLAAVLIPTFSSVIRKANVANDTAVAKNMNEALATYAAANGDVNDFEKVLAAIEEAGYVLANLNAKANGNLYAWDKANNQIVYLDAAGETIYKNTDFNKADLMVVVANDSVALPEGITTTNVIDMTKPAGAKALRGAIADGISNITLNADMDIDGATLFTNGVTLKLNEKNVSSNNGGTDGASRNSIFSFMTDATVEGNGVLSAPNGNAITVIGGTTTINGGTYRAGVQAVYVFSGNLVINGGHFEDNNAENNSTYSISKYLINIRDAARNGGSTVTIKGGTFVNFNPANNGAEGAGTNFVAEGYKVVSEPKDNGDIWYTVVAE